MSGVDLENITLYEVAKDYGEENVIGDFRRPMWQRFATIALSSMMKNPKLRPYAFQISNMVKLNDINGELLSVIIEDMENMQKNNEELAALKILAAIRNI